MQRLKKRDKSRGLRGAQIFAVSGHVAATLDHLTNQLILCQSHRHSVECRATLSALFAERMAVVTLFHLKYQGALPFEGRPVVKKLGRNGKAAPCIHDWAPRGISSEPRKHSTHNPTQ